MIGSNPFHSFYPARVADNSNTAQQLRKYSEKVKLREQMGLEGDGTGGTSFAAKLKQADEFRKSGESCGATDSIGIILRQMEEPKAGESVTKEVYHNGARVQVTKDPVHGNRIIIGGSANPDWITVSTSVGTVYIDMNDTGSLMNCLDMFSPEDLNAIIRKITEVKQARDALREIDHTKNTPVERAEGAEKKENENLKSEVERYNGDDCFSLGFVLE
ncbi:MAG: hypothetical protein HFI57_08420 [Lachnospiraceae bacterium]|nr:hypothetical protein [Lachnospiraceae bacterium]